MVANLFLYVLDDARYDQLPWLGHGRDLGGAGRIFTSCRTDTSHCQGSRVGLWTGQRAKRHGCYANNAIDLDYGADSLLDDMIIKWLNDATPSYYTGHIGKWLNSELGPRAGYDFYRGIAHSAILGATGYDVWDGTTFVITDSTTHIADYAKAEILAFLAAATEPWCLCVCLPFPHSPWGPRPGDIFNWTNPPFPRVEEPDVSDKPAWVQALGSGALSTSDKTILDADNRGRLRELSAADWVLREIWPSLDLADTTVFLTSDNGDSLGEHQRGKPSNSDSYLYDPYDTTLHLPLIVAGQGFTPGITTRPVHLQDITATMAALAGVSPPYAQDGVDLRDVQNNPGSYASRTLLHQRRDRGSDIASTCPDFDAVTTETQKLIRYFDYARPDGTISSANCTAVGAATMHECTDDTTFFGTTDYVEGTVNTAATFTVSLGNPANRDSSCNSRYRVRYAAARGDVSTDDITITMELLQGASTVIKSNAHTFTSSTRVVHDIELTPAESASITDQNDLRLRFTQSVAAAGHMRIYVAAWIYPTTTVESYQLDTDPDEHANLGSGITGFAALDSALDALLA